jgi:hypothetical protein
MFIFIGGGVKDLKGEGGGSRGGFLKMARSSLPGFLHEEDIDLVFYHKGKYLVVFTQGSKSLDIP